MIKSPTLSLEHMVLVNLLSILLDHVISVFALHRVGVFCDNQGLLLPINRPFHSPTYMWTFHARLNANN